MAGASVALEKHGAAAAGIGAKDVAKAVAAGRQEAGASAAMDESWGGFRARMLEQGRLNWRDLPWRHTQDPYAIWISEVMLQQTQVSRVDGRWQRWLAAFPTIEALAVAQPADVLQEWQGLGYNRRALSLHKAAQQLAEESLGTMPCDYQALVSLPGVGPATAAGIRAFAFDLPGVYLETNVRTVFLHELFPDAQKVPDSVLAPLVEAACPPDNARQWYYALLDYGAYLKRTLPNPSRRSAGHRKQSAFEGSRRQKRAILVRLLLEARDLAASGGAGGLTLEEAAAQLGQKELEAGRPEPRVGLVAELLEELEREGFCHSCGGRWNA